MAPSLTIFALPKPFAGHVGVIQRNAITSWTRLSPRPEVILFGDEEGTAAFAASLGIRHHPEIRRNENGTPLLDFAFARAQETSPSEIFCYANSDIVLLDDFTAAVARLAAWRKEFLMVGRRRNADITQPLDFSKTDWPAQAREFALRHGTPEPPWSVDYFVFTRGMFAAMPPFAVGRAWWDHWMIWNAISSGVPAVDASDAVLAIHQNHDYGHHPQGSRGVMRGAEAEKNLALAGGRGHLRLIEDAPYRLNGAAVEPRRWAWWPRVRRALRPAYIPVWHAALKFTRPLRHRLGLRRENLVRQTDRH